MATVEFQSHWDCELCPLHEQCTSVGIPTRYIGDLPVKSKDLLGKWQNLDSMRSPGHAAALLVVGEAPGREEDSEGVSFVGWTGRLLYRWLTESFGLHELADIYLTNAVRCKPPDNPTAGQCNKCRRYLLEDLEKLATQYDQVTVLTMGAKSTKSLTGKSIKKALVYQGSVRIPLPSTKAGDLEPYETTVQVPIFSTYHPAATSPGRSPERVHTIESHLNMLKEHLEGKNRAATQQIEWDTAPTCLEPDEPYVALDIETYGILDGQTQTVFHPHRMAQVDRVPYDRQIVSCALTYLKDGNYRNAFYNMYDRNHRKAFRKAMESLRGHWLVGMNMAFDVTCLRIACPSVTSLLTAENFYLDDLAITNHLVADLRPERSLKSISRLLGKLDYEQLEVSTIDGGHAAKSPDDPNLARYNIIDTINTLSIYLENLRTLHDRWATQPEYLDRDRWRSDLVWTTIHMQEHGMRFDRDALRELEDHLVRRRDRCFAVAKARGLILGGKGTEKSVLEFFRSCLDEANLWDDRRLKFTKKTKRVSTGKENIEFLEGNLPTTSPMRRQLKLLTNYRKSAKLISSYTKKLLHNPSEGTNQDGRAYPSWFPVPAFVKDDHGKEGGTKQGRFSAHNPPAQTSPAVIKKRQISRYPDGELWGWDQSQVELRVLALLSGDQNMMDAYLSGTDIHWETARILYPDLPESKPGTLGAEANKRRQLGKTANFLIVYRGGAKKLQETARRQLGLELDLDFCRQCILAIKEARPGVFEFQDRLIASVKKKGYIECITGWRRTFVKDGYAVDKSSVNEICNMPIQTYGAQILQSTQAEFLRWRSETGTICVMPAQIHDDINIDMPKASVRLVHSAMDTMMKEPPFWKALCESVDRWIPLDYDKTLLYPRE